MRKQIRTAVSRGDWTNIKAKIPMTITYYDIVRTVLASQGERTRIESKSSSIAET